MVDAGVALEVCPVSNVALGVYSDLTSVPLPELLAAGATVALGADDPLLFGSRLAGQYSTMRAAHDLTDEQLAELARMSVRAARAPDATKQEILAAIDTWLATPENMERVSEQGPQDPGQLPPTHRAYGDREENPFTSPSGPASQDSGPEYAAPPAEQPAYQPYAPAAPLAAVRPAAAAASYGYGGPVLPDHPQVSTAFVLGLVALVGGFLCGLPILAGPFAWVAGARARKAIDQDPRYGGREKATAGMVMGIVATSLLALVLLVFGVAVRGDRRGRLLSRVRARSRPAPAR